MDYNKLNLPLSYAEVSALQALLGYCLYHTSDEIYSIALKLEKLNNPENVNYESVVFYKNEDGFPSKKVKKHISIGFVKEKK